MSVTSAPPYILLADDDPRSCATLKAFFESMGWRYDVVGDSSRVLPAVVSSGYDVIIADVCMRGIDATQFLDSVRKQRPSQAIIALSSDTSCEKTLSFFRSGATDVVPRPIDFSWLEHIVHDIVHTLRYDEGDRRVYRYVTNEHTEISFTCRQLAESEYISLPILNRLRECGILDESATLRLKLAVQEAVMNAFEHGNLELLSVWKEEIGLNGEDKFTVVRRQRLADPLYAERRIKLISWLHDGVLEIVVRDEGQGFLQEDSEFERGVPPTCDHACSGRGLALMSSAVDLVRFAHRGSEVRLIKQLYHERGA